MPHLGRTKGGAYYMTGFCGHGAAMSTLLGKLVANDIIDKSFKLESELAQLNLMKIPFHNQHEKVLNVAESYMKIKDKLF